MALDTYPLVGRDEELASLVRVLGAIGELPRAAVLVGEAGIGKTALWRVAVEDARARGYVLLPCRPSEAEARFSFSGLADLLGGVVADVLPGIPAPQRRALEVALAVADASGQADEGAVAFAVLNAVRRLAEDAPVLLAVDDVQWLDAPSLALLGYALARLQREPVALLATARGNVPDWLLRAVHRRLAEHVAEPEERARHLALAAEGPDPRVAGALDAATRAGRLPPSLPTRSAGRS